jgi:hypothetical protein
MCKAMTLASPRMMWDGIAKPNDDGQPDRGKWRQARHGTRGGGQYETKTGGEFRKANESDECDWQVCA